MRRRPVPACFCLRGGIESQPLDKRTLLLPILILVAVNLLVFLPALRGSFLWDDRPLIPENSQLLHPTFMQRVWRIPYSENLDHGEAGVAERQAGFFYRPLTLISFWLDWKLWGLNASGFHLTNLLLQVLNSLLLFFLLLYWQRPLPEAFAAGLLFSLFPLHFENVSWISGRPDLLAFFLATWAVFCFTRFWRNGQSRQVWLAALFLLFSLLAKENTLLLTLVFLLLLWRRPGGWKQRLLLALPFLLAVFFWLLLRQQASGATPWAFSGQRGIQLLAALGFYLFRTLWPFGLSVTINPALLRDNDLLVAAGIFSLLLFIFLLFWFLRQRPQQRWLPLLLASYFFLLLPSLMLVFVPTAVSLLAWRFLYLPSAVFVSGLAFCMWRFVKRTRLFYLLLAICCLFYTWEIFPKNRLFGQDETRFWLGVEPRGSESLMAQFNIGSAWLLQNEDKAVHIYGRILEQKGDALYPYYASKVHENLAAFFTYKKDIPRARLHFDWLLKNGWANNANFAIQYAQFLALSGETSKGEALIESWLARLPENHLVLVGGAHFYLLIRNYDRAFKLLSEDIRIFKSPESQELLSRIAPLWQDRR